MFRYVFLFALLALTQVQAKEKCPAVNGKVPFDESKVCLIFSQHNINIIFLIKIYVHS
jgi:hypothetical protein